MFPFYFHFSATSHQWHSNVMLEWVQSSLSTHSHAGAGACLYSNKTNILQSVDGKYEECWNVFFLAWWILKRKLMGGLGWKHLGIQLRKEAIFFLTSTTFYLSVLPFHLGMKFCIDVIFTRHSCIHLHTFEPLRAF